jgi:hypothetical protein
MAMRGAVRLPKRAGKEFVRNTIELLVAYVPIAAILAYAAGVPLGGVVIFGGIFVPAVAALITVVAVWVGGPGDYQPRESHSNYHPGGDGGYWGDGGGGFFGGDGDGGGGGG